MAISLKLLVCIFLSIGSTAMAQELVKAPVQIPAITPAVSAFALARFLRAKEDDGTRIYDLMRPSLNQAPIVSEEIQRKSLEHIVDRAGLKEPPKLERTFDYSVAAKVRNKLRRKGGLRRESSFLLAVLCRHVGKSANESELTSWRSKG